MRLPNEHPRLPALYIDRRPVVHETTNRQGKVTRPATPAYVRVMFTPTSVLDTANPARLEQLGLALIKAADDLRAAQRTDVAAQPALFGEAS